MSRGGYEQALTFIFISFLSRRRPYRLINNPAVAVAAVLLAESPGRDGTASPIIQRRSEWTAAPDQQRRCPLLVLCKAKSLFPL